MGSSLCLQYSQSGFQDRVRVVRGAEPVVVIVIRPVSVPISVEHTRVRGIVPIPGADQTQRETHRLSLHPITAVLFLAQPSNLSTNHRADFVD